MKRLRRRGGRIKPEGEVSRWIIQMIRKEPVEEEPLIVPKVIRQYTRKKKVSEPENTLGAPQGVAAVCSEQNVLKKEVDNDNHVKMNEEVIPDFNILKGDVKNHVKMEEPNVPQNNAMTEENHVKIKQEQLSEIEFLTMNNAQYGSSEVKDISKEKQKNVAEINSSACNVSEREPQQSKVEITIKIEQTDDYGDTDSVQKNIAGCHSEAGETVRIKPKTNIECDSYNTSDKMDECKNMELEIKNDSSVIGQTFHSQNKTLLTEEINIKEEIVSDNDESELAGTSNIKEELSDEAVTAGEQELTGVTSGPQSLVTEGSRVVVRAYGKNPDIIALKKCYFVAVNVPPGVHRRRPVALRAANAQKVVDPEHLAGLTVVAKRQIFGCDMCGKDFLSKAGLRNHMTAAHTVATPYACHCGATFTHNYLLLAHKKTHSGPITCDFCSKSFQSSLKYSNHLNTHLEERFFSCPICASRYTVFYNLQRHAAKHTPSDMFQCSSCPGSFRCITDLRRHSERDHGEKVEYPCYVCSQTLCSNAELIAHMKSHDNALHECAFCTMRFTDALKWEEHSATHIERLDAIEPVLRPHVCGVCNKRFDYRSVLMSHMRSHTAERPYKCKECSKTFKTQSAVSEHEKGHDRPYPCLDCPARFAKRNSLTRHLVLHSGEKPHACAHCGRRFTQRSGMLQHVQRFHTPGLQRVKRVKRPGNKL